MSGIRFEQKLGNQLSPALPLWDETGQAVQLNNYFGTKPTILVLGYYSCPMLCNLTLNGLVECMEDLKWSVGREFQIVNVSIDPHETATLASEKRRAYLKRYGRRGAESGWHFLTGTDASIKELTEAVGFRYAFDAASKQFAHPSGLVILTPRGRVAHYLFGITFAPQDLFDSLRDASNLRIGQRVQELILLCFHYNPLHGKYSALIMRLVRGFGIATVLGLAGLVAFMVRLESQKADRILKYGDVRAAGESGARPPPLPPTP